MKKIQCDRCGKLVEESNVVDNDRGLFNVSEGFWKIFQRWEEHNVCHHCMTSDVRFKKLHPTVSS